MAYLVAVSLLWGFSFGLVKAEFSGLSGATLALLRLLIALPCFLPFIGRGRLRPTPQNAQLVLIGGIQFGLMYVALFNAFRWLNGYEVALLTIFTPLYVILADACWARRWPPAWFWWTSALAVLGALWIFQPQSFPQKLPGILLMQVANLCFAGGQVAYRHWRTRTPAVKDREVAALLYLGAVLLALPFAFPHNPVAEASELSQNQWLALLYLGSVASGLGFFLWNSGAAMVNPATLAVFNNLKIPLATLIAIFIFGESAQPGRLVPGLALMLAALAWAEWAARRPGYHA